MRMQTLSMLALVVARRWPRRAAIPRPPCGRAIARRMDDEARSRLRVDDGEVRHDGRGYHVTSGGAAIYYTTKDAQANDKFTTMANFRQTKKNTGHGDHGEAFGLFAGGQNLDDPAKQTYYYFLVRQDGQFLINHRAGKEVHKIVDWTAEPGDREVRRQAERQQRSRDSRGNGLGALHGERQGGARAPAKGTSI